MVEQLDMFAEIINKGKKELEVKEQVKSLDFDTDEDKVIAFLKSYALGKKAEVPGTNIANHYGWFNDTLKIRQLVNNIRNNIDTYGVIIGSTSNGYFIPKEDEMWDAISMLVSRLISSEKTLIKMFPPIYLLIIKIAWKTFLETDRSPNKQMIMQFREWAEKEYNERFADDLIKEKEKLYRFYDENGDVEPLK